MLEIRIILTISSLLFVSCNPQSDEVYDSEVIALNNRATEILITNPDSALILLNKATEIDKGFYPAYSNKVNVYCIKRDYENAIKAANQVINAKPDLAEAITFLGMLYDFTGQQNKAIEKYQKAIELYNKRLIATDKNKKSNRLNRAHTLLLIGDTVEGKLEVESLLNENPEDSTIQMFIDFDKDKYLSEIFK